MFEINKYHEELEDTKEVIKERQTTQRPKEKGHNNKQRSTKTCT
jgi:hypothetical protein